MQKNRRAYALASTLTSAATTSAIDAVMMIDMTMANIPVPSLTFSSRFYFTKEDKERFRHILNNS
ncbi:hypothetical protein [Geobacillus sp. ZGt-1]|nr:hypothetical protein [Geobacillus sp. ZGt-1]